jgi:hypothetical protein
MRRLIRKAGNPKAMQDTTWTTNFGVNRIVSGCTMQPILWPGSAMPQLV